MDNQITWARGGLALLLTLGLAGPALSAPVQGTVRFPEGSRGAARYATYWRIENGVVPIGPPSQDLRAESVVVLFPQGTVTGAQVAAAEAQGQKGKQKADMKLLGLRLQPPVIVVEPGTTITLRNEDRLVHLLGLSCSSGAGTPPRQEVPAGGEIALTLGKPGDCSLRSQEYAHLTGAILVVERGFYGRVDASGAFGFDAPEGHYQAKLFYQGAWVASQPIDVLADGIKLTLSVPKQPAPRAPSSRQSPAGPSSATPSTATPSMEAKAR